MDRYIVIAGIFVAIAVGINIFAYVAPPTIAEAHKISLIVTSISLVAAIMTLVARPSDDE